MIYFYFLIVIKSRFIVFKMTAQTIQTQPKEKKLKKIIGGQDIRENPPKLPKGEILKVFT